MTNTPRTPGAERQADYRRRRREKVSIARAELSRSLAESLIACGFLSKAGVSDPKRCGAALVAVARRWLRSTATKIDAN